MKAIPFLVFVLLQTSAATAQDYSVQLNDTTFDVSLDSNYEVTLHDQMVHFKITMHDMLTFEDEMFSFSYPSEFKISQNPLSENLTQYTILTAEGNGIIIQKYSTLNPTTLNEMMLNEVTKESVGYGYKLTRKDYQRKLKSGQSVDIDRAVLTYKDDVYQYEVASIGKKDGGILVLTMLLSDNVVKGKKIIDLLWDTLEFK